MENQKNNLNKGGEKGVNVKFVEEIAKAIQRAADLGIKVVDEGNPEKLANGVEKLNKNVDDTYEEIRELIANDPSIDTIKKAEMLRELAEEQKKTNREAEKAIKENRENVSKVALEIVKGLFTGGLSFVPKIVKETKDAISHKGNESDNALLGEKVETVSDNVE